MIRRTDHRVREEKSKNAHFGKDQNDVLSHQLRILTARIPVARFEQEHLLSDPIRKMCQRNGYTKMPLTRSKVASRAALPENRWVALRVWDGGRRAKLFTDEEAQEEQLRSAR